MTKLLVLIALLIVSVDRPGLAHELPLISPHAYQDKTSWRIPDSIPWTMNEQVLLWHKNQDYRTIDWETAQWAAALTVVVNQPFQRVVEVLEHAVSTKFGTSLTAGERKGTSIGASWHESQNGVWPPFGDRHEYLQVVSKTNSIPKETIILSKPYNTLQGGEAGSQIEATVIDGMPLFGRPYSIVFLRRLDHSREWATLGRLPIPLPFKIARNHFVITDTEIALLEDLKAQVPGTTLLYFIPSFLVKGPTWEASVMKAKEAVRNFVMQEK